MLSKISSLNSNILPGNHRSCILQALNYDAENAGTLTMNIFIALLMFLASVSSFAGDAAQGIQCSDETASSPSLIEVAKPGEAARPHVLKLGEYVTVKIPHEAYGAYFTRQGDNVQPIPVLYINDLPIKDLSWANAGCEKIAFFFERTQESRDLFGKMLSKLDGKDNIPLGIGTAQKGFVMDIGLVKLALGSGNMLLWYIGMILLTVLTVWLGISTGIIRDLPAGGVEKVPGKTRPFSLARVQMAWWFLLTVGAYTYIWLKTGETASILPDSVLALIGISSGTTVLSAVVDTTASNRVEERSCGFLRDILSDSDSISFHRFQMFVWSIVLGIIFVKKVWATLIMPDFDAQLLGLMGISSGTYLGFKIPAAAAAAKSGGQSA